MSSLHPQEDQSLFYVRQAFKLALSLVLFYALALWTNWDVPRYGGLAIVIVSLGTRGASIKQGLMRIAGTTAGVLIGIAILGLFNDNRWVTMLALAANIGLMCYCMQTSNYRYAWYAAAFIPLVVWADNYPQFENAFYFSTFRWLQTVVGVAIYTLVDLVLWPQRAGDQFQRVGKGLLQSTQQLLQAYRSGPTSEEHDDSVAPGRSKVAQQLAQAIASLQNAKFDTPAISSNIGMWDAWLCDIKSLADALEMWHESVMDAGDLSEKLPSGISDVLDEITARLNRAIELWDQCFEGGATTESTNAELPRPRAWQIEPTTAAAGSEFERAASLSSLRQLQILDRSSIAILTTVRQLSGEDTTVPRPLEVHEEKWFFPLTWDSERFIQSLFPVIAFVAAWFVWDLTDPPGGAKVAMLAGLLSIMVLRTPMDPAGVWIGMILSTAFVVAPICWLVMPALSTGVELLTLIFLLSFFFGCLGAKSPALKSGALIQFFASAGISNQQTYSFEGPVNGSLMVLIGGGVVTLVYNLWYPIRPEQKLLRSLRRTLCRFADFAREFQWDKASVDDRQARYRTYLLRAKLQPVLNEFQSAVSTLDYDRYPNNEREDWLALADGLQSLAFRLESLAMTYRPTFERMIERPSLVEKAKQTMTAMAEILDSLSTTDRPDDYSNQRQLLDRLREELQIEMFTLHADKAGQPAERETLIDIYALFGSMRTVVRAIDSAHAALNRVNCEELAAPRF